MSSNTYFYPTNSFSSRLFNSNLYIGSKKTNWIPESEKFILGYKNKTSLFNLGAVNFFFSRAKSFVESAIIAGSRGFFFGLFENYTTMFSYLNKFFKLDQVVVRGGWRGGLITNAKFFRFKLLNGSKKFNFMVAFRFDYSSFPLVGECKRISIPLIAPVDSNSNPSYFDYPVPGNSSSFGLNHLMAKEFLHSAYSGIQKRYRLSAGGTYSFPFNRGVATTNIRKAGNSYAYKNKKKL